MLEANLELVRRGLVLYTFGNASGISREKELIVIKPSGLAYEKMKPEHLVITDLQGKLVEGDLRPSSDLADASGSISSFFQKSAASLIRIPNMPRRGAQARESRFRCFRTTSC